MLERVWRRVKPSYTVGECKLVQKLWKTVWQCLKKPKPEFPYDPAIPVLSIYLVKNYTLKRFMHPLFIAPKPTIAKTWEKSYCPWTDEWIKKMHMLIHTENGTPLRHLENEIMPFAAAWMDLEINILMEADRKRKTIFM